MPPDKVTVLPEVPKYCSVQVMEKMSYKITIKYETKASDMVAYTSGKIKFPDK